MIDRRRDSRQENVKSHLKAQAGGAKRPFGKGFSNDRFIVVVVVVVPSTDFSRTRSRDTFF